MHNFLVRWATPVYYCSKIMEEIMATNDGIPQEDSAAPKDTADAMGEHLEGKLIRRAKPAAAAGPSAALPVQPPAQSAEEVLQVPVIKLPERSTGEILKDAQPLFSAEEGERALDHIGPPSEVPAIREKKETEYLRMSTTDLREIVRNCGAGDLSQLTAGVILLREGYLTPEELKKYIKKAAPGKQNLEELLRRERVLSENDAMMVYAERIKMDFVDFSVVGVDPLAVRFLDGVTATQYSVFPYAIKLESEGDKTIVYMAMAEPENILLKDYIHSAVEEDGTTEVVFTVATASSIKEQVSEHYREIFDIDSTIEEVEEEEEEEETAVAEQLAAQDAPVVKLVNQIIASGVNEGASDIHCETSESKDMAVRFRVDGVLRRVSPIPRRMRAEVVNRFKIMGSMDIADKMVPQDGRATIKLRTGEVDLRLVSIPTIYGENVSIRILDKSTLKLQIDELGFNEYNVKSFQKGVQKPHGMVLVTGPTGSGKTTSLYSALLILNKDRQNIVTIEDPVEYKIPGVNQCQINEDRNLDFTTALRGFMRADPDVIMVGEIRDPATAKIGVEAALSGHLVLSTLHTNDAPSAIVRLTEMGVEAYALASTLECIVAQRLCRKLCSACRVPHTPTVEELKANAYPDYIVENISKHTFYLAHPDGCNQCGHEGYKGRIAISEVLTVTDNIKQMILERKSAPEIKTQAVAEGMIPILEDGFQKIAEGITTVEEMRRQTM